MTAPADTEWAPTGSGQWRIYRGVTCRVEIRGMVIHGLRRGGTCTAEVDARRLESAGPTAYATFTADAEADARAWCERWADVIAKEVRDV